MEQFTPFDRIFSSCGRIWHMRRADMDTLWADMEKREGEERLPYWNEIWPSSLALAGWLAEMVSRQATRPAFPQVPSHYRGSPLKSPARLAVALMASVPAHHRPASASERR